jgi:predicted ATP-grasp superfamily ATP-dependent carboligase
MTDATTWPLASRPERFAGWTRLGAPDRVAVERSSDKLWAATTAAECGIPAPPTLLARSIDDLDAARDWGFPLVVKDRFSIRWHGEVGREGAVRFAFNREELVALVERRLTGVGDVLVQRFTPGVGIGFSGLVADGRVLLPFQWRRVREKDPRGSGSSARCSVPLDPRVLEFSTSLLDRSGFRGLAMVEFKQDPATGDLSLMEINGRPWGSLQLPIYCGLDYPRHLVDWLLDDRPPPERIDYKVGIMARWLAADLVHLENLWNGPPPGWPVPYPRFWKSVLSVALPWYPGLKYDDFAANDVRPGMAGLGRWCRRHLPGQG